MKFLFGGNPFFILLGQSDFVTKLVICFLFLMSIVCWTIFLYKIVLFRIKNNQMKKVLQYLKKVHTIDDIRTMSAAFSQTLPGYVISKNLSFLKSILEIKQDQMLTEHELELLHQRIDQTIDAVIYNEESYLTVLLSCAAAAPLIGLFGTVWGLIHSFIRISQTQQADIATIAPGIAEALITTLVGLVVAIPALLIFHYLSSRVRRLEHQLLILSDKLAWLVQTVCMKGE